MGILDLFANIAYYLAMNHQNINFDMVGKFLSVEKVDVLMIHGQVISDIRKKV